MLYLRYFVRIFCIFCFLFISSSCVKEKCIKDTKKSVFIAFPENNFSFNNVSSILHEKLVTHFVSLGYTVVLVSSHNDYAIKTRINKLDSIHNYISPDMIIVNSLVEMNVDCCIEFGNKCVKNKNIKSIMIGLRSKKPMFNEHNDFFCFYNLAKKMAIKIEQFFNVTVQKKL